MNQRIIDVAALSGSQRTTVIEGQGYFPVIAAAPSGNLLVVLRGGAPHMGLGGRLDAVRSTDGGRTWTSPVTIADSERDDRNPALGFNADGHALLAYHWQGSYDEDGQWAPERGPTDTRVVRSQTEGESWAEDRKLNWLPLNGASPFGKIRRDAENTLYLPMYSGVAPPRTEGAVSVAPATCPVHLLRSYDGGETWADPLLVAMGLNEADFLILSDNDWLFAGRSEERDEQAIYTCRSSDRGHSWTDLTRVTERSEHPPDLTDLGGGAVLLTYGRRHEPYGIEGRVSRDGGNTWESPLLRFDTNLTGTDIGYPSTVRQGDHLVTVYYVADKTQDPIAESCRAVLYDRETLLERVGRGK